MLPLVYQWYWCARLLTTSRGVILFPTLIPSFGCEVFGLVPSRIWRNLHSYTHAMRPTRFRGLRRLRHRSKWRILGSMIYQQHHFSLVYLSVMRNLPRSMGWLFVQQVLTYFILLLPECAWLFTSYSIVPAAGSMALMISVVMLFHCILYYIGLAMNKYLPWLLGLFLAVWVFILFGMAWLLAPVCLVVSFMLFYFNYYKEELDVQWIRSVRYWPGGFDASSA